MTVEKILLLKYVNKAFTILHVSLKSSLKQDKLRKQGYIAWKMGSDRVYFYTICVHSDYTGWALFIDCDFISKQDVADLFALADDKYAVMCPIMIIPKKEKMDGKA